MHANKNPTKHKDLKIIVDFQKTTKTKARARKGPGRGYVSFQPNQSSLWYIMEKKPSL